MAPGVVDLWEDHRVRRTPSGPTRARTVGALVVAVALLALGCSSGSAGAGADADAGSSVTGPIITGDACRVAPDGPTTIAYEEVAGVDPTLLSLDVYGPPAGCAPAPVVFWVHGGGWSAGDKANEGTATKAAWAAAHGWALVAVNYRLSTPGSGVVWPTHGEDVASAVGYTLDHADELGLDADHVALMGHSAGAHIVSFLAVDPGLLSAAGRSTDDVDCLVALDTEGYDLSRRISEGSDLTDQMIGAAFGTDPAGLVDASPLHALQSRSGRGPDAVVVTRGLPARRDQARDFADALGATGAAVTVVDATGYSHRDVNQRLGTPDDTVVTPPVTSFLEECLA